MPRWYEIIKVRVKKLTSLNADSIQKTKEVNKDVYSAGLPSTGEKEDTSKSNASE